MCDNQVSGCQLAAWKVEKAQATPESVRPRATIRLSVR